MSKKLVKVETVASLPAWVIGNDEVELAVTQLGAHMATSGSHCKIPRCSPRPYSGFPTADVMGRLGMAATAAWDSRTSAVSLPKASRLRGIRDRQPGLAGACRLAMIGSDEFAGTQHQRACHMKGVQGPAAS